MISTSSVSCLLIGFASQLLDHDTPMSRSSSTSRTSDLRKVAQFVAAA
jgi:hypothetical protein